MSTTPEDLGKLVLRLCLGILMLFHGWAKIQGGVDWLAGPLGQHGLPSVVAYGVYAGEVVGPLLIVIGLMTRLGALLVIFNMAFAVGLMHMEHLFEIGQTGGLMIELQLFFLFTALAVALLGAGRFSLGGHRGFWN